MLTVDVNLEARAVGDRGHLSRPLRADCHRPARVLRVFEAQQGSTVAASTRNRRNFGVKSHATLIGRGGQAKKEAEEVGRQR